MRFTLGSEARWMRQLVATVGIMSLFCAATAASAAIVPVVNSSFETPIANPVTTFTPGAITGWVLSDPTGQGVFNPGNFPASGITATDGVQTAYLDGGQISQVLPTLLTAGTAYKLQVDVGDRVDNNFPGYRVQLFAGSTLLAEEFSLLPSNGFLTSTVNFQTFGGPLIGQPLQIVLVSNGSQINFDNVRLETAPAVPVPASLAIWGVGVLGLGLAYRRRKKAAK